MFTKPLTRALWYILIKSFFVAIGRSYVHDLSPTFLKRLKLLWGEIACLKRIVFYRLRPNIKIFLFCTVFPTIKTLSQNVSMTLLQIPFLTLTWRRLLEEKGPVIDFRRTVSRNIAASIIGNGFISLLWHLRCHCSPDHNKFSSLSNTTVVAVFQIFVYGDVVYAQTWQVLTLKNCIEPFMPVRPMLLHRPSFLFDSFVKIWATWKNVWANGLPPPPPPGKK